MESLATSRVVSALLLLASLSAALTHYLIFKTERTQFHLGVQKIATQTQERRINFLDAEGPPAIEHPVRSSNLPETGPNELDDKSPISAGGNTIPVGIGGISENGENESDGMQLPMSGEVQLDLRGIETGETPEDASEGDFGLQIGSSASHEEIEREAGSARGEREWRREKVETERAHGSEHKGFDPSSAVQHGRSSEESISVSNGTERAFRDIHLAVSSSPSFSPPHQPIFAAQGKRHDDAKGEKSSSKRWCNYYDGTWVPFPPSSLPQTDKSSNDYSSIWQKGKSNLSYRGRNCKWLAPNWACRLSDERKDFGYEKMEWVPRVKGCALPFFNAKTFLKRHRNSNILFAGDSLGQQHFQALLCALSEERDDGQLIKDVGDSFGFKLSAGARRPDGWAFRFVLTNTTVIFVWSISLCEIERGVKATRLQNRTKRREQRESGGAKGGGSQVLGQEEMGGGGERGGKGGNEEEEGEEGDGDVVSEKSAFEKDFEWEEVEMNALHLDRPFSFLNEWWEKMDVIVLNTGHHWNRGKINENSLELYINGSQVLPSVSLQMKREEGGNEIKGYSYQRKWRVKYLTIGEAHDFALRSLGGWIHERVMEGRARERQLRERQLREGRRRREGEATEKVPIVFWTSLSPRHFLGGDWNTRGRCDHIKRPLTLHQVRNHSVSTRDHFTESALLPFLLPASPTPSSFQQRSIRFLNISLLSSFRADAHPSKWDFRNDAKTNDCLHWCLPGVPDVWNRILAKEIMLSQQMRKRREGRRKEGRRKPGEHSNP